MPYVMPTFRSMVRTPWLDLRFIVYQTVGLKSGEYYSDTAIKLYLNKRKVQKIQNHYYGNIYSNPNQVYCVNNCNVHH